MDDIIAKFSKMNTTDTLSKLINESQSNNVNPRALFNLKTTTYSISNIELPKNTSIVKQNKSNVITKFYTKKSLILPYTTKQRLVGQDLGDINVDLINVGRRNKYGAINYTVEKLRQIAKTYNISTGTLKTDLVRDIREYLGL